MHYSEYYEIEYLISTPLGNLQPMPHPRSKKTSRSCVVILASFALGFAGCGVVQTTPTSVPVIETLEPTTQVPTPTATLTPSPTPTSPLETTTLDALRARSYPGGAIRVVETLATTPEFTQYLIAYPSDGLTVTGVMQVPAGDGPFPVIILNHGYYPRRAYRPGDDTDDAAAVLARHGYLTLAPDYRGWGKSDTGLSLFQMGLVIDVINLVSAVPSLKQADASRIGMWGHSMGGGITTKVLIIDERVRAAVLYAPNSPDDADLIARWGPACLPGQPEEDPHCDAADMLPPGTPSDLIDAYLIAAADPTQIQLYAPYAHLDRISAPIQIHIGDKDGASLPQTPPQWAFKLFHGLQAAGKPAVLFEYPGQGHYFQGASWDLFMTRAVVLFDGILK